MKILLLEDDKTLHESLKAYLEMENFTVFSAFNAEEAYDITYEETFDLYIFDINLGGEDGFEVLSALRKSDDFTPTVYITARTDISSMSKGFAVGADDYIKKPFDPEELVLRIRSRYVVENLIYYKNISYDPIKKEIKKDEKVIGLSSILSALFHLFITNKNAIVSTSTLLDELLSPNSNALRVNIAKLKSKLDLEIRNIKGVGYMLEEI